MLHLLKTLKAKEYCISFLCKEVIMVYLKIIYHCRLRPIDRESSHSANSWVTVITNTSVLCICSRFWKEIGRINCAQKIILHLFNTSKTPRLRPNFPTTPASSNTSRNAVTEGSSSGSTPPPGTIHKSGCRDDVTRRTWFIM